MKIDQWAVCQQTELTGRPWASAQRCNCARRCIAVGSGTRQVNLVIRAIQQQLGPRQRAPIQPVQLGVSFQPAQEITARLDLPGKMFATEIAQVPKLQAADVNIGLRQCRVLVVGLRGAQL